MPLTLGNAAAAPSEVADLLASFRSMLADGAKGSPVGAEAVLPQDLKYLIKQLENRQIAHQGRANIMNTAKLAEIRKVESMKPMEKLAQAYIAVMQHPEEYLADLDKTGRAEDRKAMADRARKRHAAGTAPTLNKRDRDQLSSYQAAADKVMGPKTPTGTMFAKK